jgi:hypothetical protein
MGDFTWSTPELSRFVGKATEPAEVTSDSPSRPFAGGTIVEKEQVD